MSDCIEWQHSKTANGGYGQVNFGGKVRRVHRFVFELYHGYLPPVVMHTCDNPACYNIEHLRGGTQADNIRDAADKKRIRNQNTQKDTCKRGHTLRYYGGRRVCFVCKNASARKIYQLKRKGA